jgi:hypothetical protein
MRERCYSKNDKRYDRYGGRGIKVCERWINSFSNFYEDMGPKPSSRHSIDRINNEGNYEPSNCRWATPQVQMINRGLLKSNKSGYAGIYFYKHGVNKWHASIRRNNKRVNLGYFNTLELAVNARKLAEIKYYKPLLSAR